jgi:hypothetical protein
MFKAFIANRLTKVAAGGIGAILAAIGGVTTIGVLQPAVEKAADYGARAVRGYCELPLSDRERFRDEVRERLDAVAFNGEVRVICPSDQ